MFVVIWIAVFSILGAFIAAFFTQKIYYSNVDVYIRPSAENGAIIAEDLNAGQEVANDFIEIIQSREVLEKAILDLHLENMLDAESLADLIYAAPSYYQSRIVRIKFAGIDPRQTQQIAQTVSEYAIQKTIEITGVQWAVIADPADLPKRQVYPIVWMTVLQSAAFSCAVLLLMLVLFTRKEQKICGTEDIVHYLNISVLAVIPKGHDKRKETFIYKDINHS